MRRRIATSALILMATLLLLASLPPTRILLPLPSALVQQLTGLLASRLGVSLRLGAVSLHLDGAKPSLVMYELGLADPDGEADRLSAERIEISLAVGDSLRAGGVVIERLHLVGARLAVRIDPSGRISLDGLDAPIAGHADWLAPLLQTPRIDLEGGQILIKDARPHHPGWMLDALQLGIARDGTQHRLRLDAVPGLRARGSDSATGDSRDQAVAHLAVRAQLTGERTDPNTWSGLLHVSLKADDLAGLLAQDIPETRLARHARGHIQGWIDLQAGRLAQALGAIDLRPGEPCAHAKREHDQSPSAGDLHLESMRAMARLEPEDTGWRVMIGALDGRIAGLPLPAGTLELRLSPAGRPEQLRIRGDRIELALLATLAESLQRFVSPSMLAIARAGPWGRLERIDARAEWLAPTGARWSVAARGVGVGWRHTGMRPGVDGLDLRILATADGGALILDTAAAELDLGGR
ncbi:MAG: hypothetical protein EOM91_11515, partial [Sphingobacteriia bacterium]|nr:hypothetical protein [Sphingobacteriia bacterium]